MIVSDEQRHAITGARLKQWTWVDVPVGPQPIPWWVKDAHVDWLLTYSNPPSVRLKACADLWNWPEKRFTRDGSRFMACAPDGRACVYYQDGPISPATLKRWRCHDGTTKHQPSEHDVRRGGAWEEYEGLATRQEKGFAGRHIPIVLADGREVTLRGPWHGGAPDGFVEVSYVDVGAPHTRAYMEFDMRRSSRKPGSIWLKQTAYGGLFLREETFIHIVARFLPWVRVARCSYGKTWTRLELVHSAWPAPKGWLTPDQVKDAA